MTVPIIALRGVRKSFGDAVAVHDVDLDIDDGSFFSIIGPSGCGKTTTLRMLAGFETPDEGTITVQGKDITRLRPHQRPVNTVFQSYALFPHLDVTENIAFGLREARIPKQEISDRVRRIVELVRLTGRETAKPAQLSGGQQQRVALARALVNQPAVLLLDEPLGALDMQLRKSIQVQLKDLQREVGVTFVYVTHDQGEAFSMSDRVAVMNNGVIEQADSPEAIYRRPATAFAAGFVGAANLLPGRVVAAQPGGQLVTDITGFGPHATAGTPGLGVGAAVTAVIRPENLVIGQDDASGPLVTVTDVSYLGATVEISCDLESGTRLVASRPSGDSPVTRGEEVSIGWEPGSVWCVPADD